MDDTATPGAAAQILWPGDADGTAGNGDSWLLAVSKTARVLLLPSTLTMVNRTCTTLAAYAEDADGRSYAIDPDTLFVYDGTDFPALGTITTDGLFCATKVGTTYPIAGFRGQYGYATVTITPALTPSVASITLRTRAGPAPVGGEDGRDGRRGLNVRRPARDQTVLRSDQELYVAGGDVRRDVETDARGRDGDDRGGTARDCHADAR